MKTYGTPPLAHAQKAIGNLEAESSKVIMAPRIGKSQLRKLQILWLAVNNPNKEFRITKTITSEKFQPDIVGEIKTEIEKSGLPNMMVYRKLNRHWYIKFKQ